MAQRPRIAAPLSLKKIALLTAILVPCVLLGGTERDSTLGPDNSEDYFSSEPGRLPERAKEPTSDRLPDLAQTDPNKPADKKSGGTSSMVVEPQSQGGAGFADSPWKATFSQVKSRLKNLATAQAAEERVEILMEVRNVYILVRRNDVLYRYNFYKTPLEVSRLTNHEMTAQEKDAEEGLLYHVKVSMPFIETPMVKKRLETAHGAASRSTVDKKSMSGVDIWELPSGMIFQWGE
ncbi:MAG: hypothetical protein HY042_06965, partial [Spirochaetia bacterium]|nr:hypothetical protein [Spirochaetia bacterium]